MVSTSGMGQCTWSRPHCQRENLALDLLVCLMHKFLVLSFLRKINSRFQVKHRLIFGLQEILVRLLFLSWANRWSALLIHRLKNICYTVYPSGGWPLDYVASNPILLWRAQTLLSKEPETIEWINSMAEGDILFDIGANVGMYSIYAGKRGCRVYAFEPEASNYHILNKNIQINDLSSRVSAYCLALADREELSELKLTSDIPGSAHTIFGPNEQFGQTDNPVIFAQGCLGMGLDDFITKYKMAPPRHLKIDVDGIEAKIIRGASNLIQGPHLQSLLIELDESLEDDQWIKKFLRENRFQIVVTGKGTPALKQGGMIKNYIFKRV